ncbi:MAG: family 16 glycoside hydrolase [Verrucomicrobiales bacterium]
MGDFWSVEDGAIAGRKRQAGAVEHLSFHQRKSSGTSGWIFEVKQSMSPKHSTMHSAVAALGEKIEDGGGNTHGFRGPLLMFCHDWGVWDAHRRNRVEPANHKGTLNGDWEKKGEWNRIEILALGDRIRFAANGKLVFDFTDKPGMLTESPLGLQLHANRQPQEFRFRGLIAVKDPKDQMVTVAGE